MMREKGITSYYFTYGAGERKPLGFELRVNDFSLTYYDNGAPKEYRSDLTVIDNGQEVLNKSIVVNDPLSYKGFTFYQSSYQAYDEYWVSLQNQNTGERKNGERQE
jgi:cytochrome c biogenesis protein